MTAAGDSRELDRLREAAQARLEKGVGDGKLTLEEYSEQAAIVWSRDVDVEGLRRLVPVEAPAAPVSRPQSTIVGIFGDTMRSGRWSLAGKTLALLVFGDVKLDLRSAVIGARTSTITLVTLFGDSTITVPEGVHVRWVVSTSSATANSTPVHRIPGPQPRRSASCRTRCSVT